MTTVIMQGLISGPWSGEHEQKATYSENDLSLSIEVSYNIDIETKIIDGFRSRDVSEYLSVEAVGKLTRDGIEIINLEVVG